jgi:hypothetical protein
MSTSLPPSSVTNVSPINASLASQIALPLPGGTDFTTLDKRLERVFYDTDFDSIGDAMALFAANSTERYQFVMTEENVVVSGLVIPGNLDITCIADGQFTDGGFATTLAFTTGATLRSQWTYPFSDLMVLTGDVLCDIGGENPYILLIAAAGSIYRTQGAIIGSIPDIFISFAHNSWYSIFTGVIVNWALSFTVTTVSPELRQIRIIAPLLLDSQVIWTCPNGSIFTGKQPTPDQFVLNGDYTVWALDQSKITGIFTQSFRGLNIDLELMTWPENLDLFSVDVSTSAGDLATVVFPSALERLVLGHSPTITGVVGDITLPVSLEQLTFIDLALTGDITSIVWPPNIAYIDLEQNADLTGDISTLVLPVSARSLHLMSTSVTGDLTNATSLQNLTVVDLTATDVTGDLSTIVWSDDIQSIKLVTLALTDTEVDDILVAIETDHLTAAGILYLQGNTAPTATGLAAKTSLEDAGWYVRVSS